jgi:hypothetical protein
MANTYASVGNSGGGSYVIATYWETVNSTSGTITLPSGSTILLNQFQDLEDAVVSETSSGVPTFNAATSSGGARVVATFDTNGNYSLSPSPSSFPVAVMFRVLILEGAINYNDLHIVLEDIHRPGGGGLVNSASNVGGGIELYKQLSSGNLEFRTITAGSGVVVTQNSSSVEISSTGGTSNSYNPGGWG